ncbi:hypothetical protein PR048_003742 [Dryococelus australis]|uniref:Uncharacterized protein n=1 Tax=Dryococelus australis TaxID=614101 RepID=A0ABQ9IP16_9NEOP|nr:hypothetical protein PR048_003742 [Dryococelus australis]
MILVVSRFAIADWRRNVAWSEDSQSVDSSLHPLSKRSWPHLHRDKWWFVSQGRRRPAVDVPGKPRARAFCFPAADNRVLATLNSLPRASCNLIDRRILTLPKERGRVERIGVRAGIPAVMEDSYYTTAVRVLAFGTLDLLTNSRCDNRAEHLPPQRHRGANPRPSDYKSATLPLSYEGSTTHSLVNLYSMDIDIPPPHADKASRMERFERLSTARSSETTRGAIEVNTERRRNEGAGETGDHRENPPTSGIAVTPAEVGGERANRSATEAPKLNDVWKNTAEGQRTAFPITTYTQVQLHRRTLSLQNEFACQEHGGTSLTKSPPPAQGDFSQLEVANQKVNLTRCHCSKRPINEWIPVRQLASQHGEPVLIPGLAHFGFSQVGIVPDDAAGLRVFSGISRFPRSLIPALLHNHLTSPSSALKTFMLRAVQIYSLTHSKRNFQKHVSHVINLVNKKWQLA